MQHCCCTLAKTQELRLVRMVKETMTPATFAPARQMMREGVQKRMRLMAARNFGEMHNNWSGASVPPSPAAPVARTQSAPQRTQTPRTYPERAHRPRRSVYARQFGDVSD